MSNSKMRNIGIGLLVIAIIVGAYFVSSNMTAQSFGVIDGHVKDATTLLIMSGVTISANGHSSVTDVNGYFSITMLTGVFSVTASKSGYQPNTLSGITVVKGQTTSIEVSLISLTQDTGTIVGYVRDALNSSVIQGAVVAADGHSSLTDSVGYFSVTMPVGTFSVTASKSGYQSNTRVGIVVLKDQATSVDIGLVQFLLGISFSDGFETETDLFSTIWSGKIMNGGTAIIDSSIAHHGIKSAKISTYGANQFAYFQKDLGSYANLIYARCYVRFDTLATVSSSYVGCGPMIRNSLSSSSSSLAYCAYGVSSSGAYFWGIRFGRNVGYTDYWSPTPSVIQPNVWYCLEIKVSTNGAQVTGIELKVYQTDGTLIITVTKNDALIGDRGLPRVVGVPLEEYGSSNVALNEFIDCFAVSTSPIGVEA